MGEDPIDPVPQLIAALDQEQEQLPMLAKLYRVTYEAFVDAGFKDEQALELTWRRVHAALFHSDD